MEHYSFGGREFTLPELADPVVYQHRAADFASLWIQLLQLQIEYREAYYDSRDAHRLACPVALQQMYGSGKTTLGMGACLALRRADVQQRLWAWAGANEARAAELRVLLSSAAVAEEAVDVDERCKGEVAEGDVTCACMCLRAWIVLTLSVILCWIVVPVTNLSCRCFYCVHDVVFCVALGPAASASGSHTLSPLQLWESGVLLSAAQECLRVTSVRTRSNGAA